MGYVGNIRTLWHLLEGGNSGTSAILAVPRMNPELVWSDGAGGMQGMRLSVVFLRRQAGQENPTGLKR